MRHLGMVDGEVTVLPTRSSPVWLKTALRSLVTAWCSAALEGLDALSEEWW